MIAIVVIVIVMAGIDELASGATLLVAAQSSH
jgi:hypothetical protein